MKKSRKQELAWLENELKGFEKNNPLPEELSKDNIIMKIEGGSESDYKSTNKRKRIKYKAIISVAAAFLVVCSSLFFYNFFSINNAENILNNYDSAASVENYEQIEEIFKALRQESSRISKGLNLDGFVTNDNAAPESAGYKASANDSSAYGKTNIQVAGIDEPDVVKNDGKYLYISTHGKIVIVEMLPANNMKIVSEIIVFKPENRNNNSSSEVYDSAIADMKYDGYSSSFDMFVYNNTLIIMYSDNRESDKTCTDLYDITSRANPKLLKSIKQDGYYLSARIVESRLYILSNSYIYENKPIIPMAGTGGDMEKIPAADICVVSQPKSESYLIACGIDINNLDAGMKKTAVLGAGNNAYCNENGLFVSNEIYDLSNGFSKTEIMKFSIDTIKPELVASEKIEGGILNQFSMDEYKDHFRIATTSQGSNGSSSNVFILDKDLKVTGKINNIAPNERIYSVRFFGDKGYVVTFEQIDPLFVIDLVDPKNPKILGELKIPGFSNYLHPVGENLLLGIGKGSSNVDPSLGSNTNVKISLFDISNPLKPKELDNYLIGAGENAYSYTLLENNHKSFMIYPEKGIYGFPLSIQRMYDNSEFSLFTFKIINNKIEKYKVYIADKQEVIRGTYLDENIYTVSSDSIASFSLTNGKQIGKLVIINEDDVERENPSTANPNQGMVDPGEPSAQPQKPAETSSADGGSGSDAVPPDYGAVSPPNPGY